MHTSIQLSCRARGLSFESSSSNESGETVWMGKQLEANLGKSDPSWTAYAVWMGKEAWASLSHC